MSDDATEKFRQFWRSWQDMARRDGDIGNPTAVEIWHHAYKAGRESVVQATGKDHPIQIHFIKGDE